MQEEEAPLGGVRQEEEAAIYGEPALGWNPELLQMAYEAVGGAERWAPDPDEERR